MKENKNFYKVLIYTINTKSDFYKGGIYKYTMEAFLAKCKKLEKMQLIVYKTWRGKFKEIITDIEIPALWKDSYGYNYITKELPFFFYFSKKYSSEKLETMLATSLDIENYIDENLNKSEYDSYNNKVNKKDMFRQGLLKEIENAKEEFIKYTNNQGVIVKGTDKLQKERNKELVKKLDSYK